MKNSKILQAYNATEALADNNAISDDIQWEIYQLRKKLFPHIEFTQERLETIKSKYAEFADDKGNLIGEKADEFKNEVQSLNDLEKDTSDISKFTFVVKAGHGVTAKIMEALEDFIDFEKS